MKMMNMEQHVQHIQCSLIEVEHVFGGILSKECMEASTLASNSCKVDTASLTMATNFFEAIAETYVRMMDCGDT